jgi:hypothetical protein
MKAIGLSICLGTCVLLGTTGMSQSKAAVSVTVAAAHSTVKSGEEVYVNVTLTNNSNRVVTIELTSPLCDYAMEVRDSAGKLAPDTEAKSKSDCANPYRVTGADTIGQLKPNESVTNAVSVSMFSDLSHPGQYSVQVEWKAPKELGAIVAKSNVIKINVVP